MEPSSQKTIGITILIIHYQTWEATIRLLRALGFSEEVEILIIDNGPDDSLQKALEGESFQAKHIKMEKNVGYAGAINRGLSMSRGEWIMVLNNDIVCSVQDVIELQRSAKKHQRLVASPKLTGQNGVPQDTVGVFDSWHSHLINFLFMRPRFLKTTDITSEIDCDFATGGAIIFHRNVIETIGKWDERFFMYFEDIDFGIRLKKAGIPIHYAPQVVFRHTRSLTTNLDPQKKSKNYETSKAKYIEKHRGFLIKLLNDLIHVY